MRRGCIVTTTPASWRIVDASWRVVAHDSLATHCRWRVVVASWAHRHHDAVATRRRWRAVDALWYDGTTTHGDAASLARRRCIVATTHSRRSIARASWVRRRYDALATMHGRCSVAGASSARRGGMGPRPAATQRRWRVVGACAINGVNGLSNACRGCAVSQCLRRHHDAPTTCPRRVAGTSCAQPPPRRRGHRAKPTMRDGGDPPGGDPPRGVSPRECRAPPSSSEGPSCLLVDREQDGYESEGKAWARGRHRAHDEGWGAG